MPREVAQKGVKDISILLAFLGLVLSGMLVPVRLASSSFHRTLIFSCRYPQIIMGREGANGTMAIRTMMYDPNSTCPETFFSFKFVCVLVGAIWLFPPSIDVANLVADFVNI